jgi:cytidine deaminase
MSKHSSDHEISRRTALAVLGSVGCGLAVTGIPLFGDESRSDALRKLLPKFRDKSRSVLLHLMEDPEFSGQIPSADVSSMARSENTSVDNLMLQLIPLARSYSRAPISNFFVGVVVRGESGGLYIGANIEIPRQCLGFAVHAEQSALSNAYMHSEKSVTALAVGGAPCGHCRQFIDEMSPDGEIMILTPDKAPAKLSTILPAAFGPAALGMTQGAFPVRETGLALVKESTDSVAMAALDAARKSYAPYSKSPSGVAIRSSSGRIYRGAYIENVAFNPSLSPMQTALAGMIRAGEPYAAIAGVVLVEVQEAKISQRAVTETVLTAIAPAAKLEVSFARA